MMLRWVIWLLILALVARVVTAFLHGLRAGVSGPRPGASTTGGSIKSMPLVRDPICGTYVEPSRAVSERTGSTVHYFCSESCRRSFRQSA